MLSRMAKCPALTPKALDLIQQLMREGSCWTRTPDHLVGAARPVNG
jgi:hypothetical protein